MKVKKFAAAVAVAAPVAATLGGGAAGIRRLPQGCGGDLCMQVVAESGNVATIKMWAYSYRFYGHFQLQMPNHRSTNGPNNQWWYAGGAGYTFASWNGGVGQWCGTAYSYNKLFGYSRAGYLCLHA